MKRICIALIPLFFCLSCEKQKQESDLISEFKNNISKLLNEGKINESILMIDSVMSNPNSSQVRPLLFANSLSLLAQKADTDQIKSHYLKYAITNETMAEQGFNALENAMKTAGKDRDFEELCFSLVDQPLPSSVLFSAYSQALAGCISSNNRDKFSELALKAISVLPSNSAVSLIDLAANNAIDSRNKEIADAIARLLENYQTDDPEYKSLNEYLKVRFSLRFSGVSSAANEFKSRFANLDQRAVPLFNEIVSEANKDNDLIMDLSDFVLSRVKQKNQLFHLAARKYINSARATKKPELIISSLQHLKEIGFPPAYLSGEIEMSLYDAMLDAPKEHKQQLLELAFPLFDEIKKEKDKHEISMLILDLCALTEDYNKALAILDKGIPLMDEKNAKMTRSKILAHIALSSGDNRNAIKYLEDFIALLEPNQWFPDPADGPGIPSDYVKALNCSRIAELHAKLGEPEASAKKFAESKAIYESLLKNPSIDPRLKEKITAQLSSMP